MNAEDIASAIASNDPSLGLRAALALHRLAERLEADHVATARQQASKHKPAVTIVQVGAHVGNTPNDPLWAFFQQFRQRPPNCFGCPA